MSTEPLGRRETIELLRRHGILLDRRRGQHFLVEPNVVRRIVEAAGVGAGHQVVEIGPGAGTLTRELAGTGARVVAYEIDEALRPVLEDALAGLDGAEVRFADATEVDLDAELPPGDWTMVANLPYNVGTPLVLDVLRHVPRIGRLVVMLQRESVDRLAAAPGSRRYGLPSVVVGLTAAVRVVLRVPGHLFTPATPVSSAVAVLDRVEADPLAERAIAIAAVAFGQRRKMLRSSLAGIFSSPGEVIESAGLSATARPEDLSPGDFIGLARAA